MSVPLTHATVAPPAGREWEAMFAPVSRVTQVSQFAHLRYITLCNLKILLVVFNEIKARAVVKVPKPVPFMLKPNSILHPQ